MGSAGTTKTGETIENCVDDSLLGSGADDYVVHSVGGFHYLGNCCRFECDGKSHTHAKKYAYPSGDDARRSGRILLGHCLQVE